MIITLTIVLLQLVTFLWLSYECRMDDEPMESWNKKWWYAILFSSFIFPIGLILNTYCMVQRIWPDLVKERGRREDSK